MPDHVVLVVHGVGEQEAGASVQELVGAACTSLGCLSRPDTDWQLLSEPETDDGLLRQFPCHTSEIMVENGPSITFAEVFWADLSPAPKGAFSTVFDLFSVILGLGYLALDNVQNNLRADGGTPVPNAVARWLADVFVWLFYSLIAPINAFLFFGAIVLLLDPYVLTIGTGVGQWSPTWVFAGLGLLVTIAGALARKAAKSYLTRSFWGALFVMGLLALAAAIVSVPDQVSQGVYAILCDQNSWRWSREFGTESLAIENMLRLSQNKEVDCFVMRGVDALNIVWFSATVVLFAMFVIGAAGRLLSSDAVQVPFNLRSIYLAICSAMMMFWLLISIAFWAAFANLVGTLQVPVGDDGPVPPLILEELIQRHFGQATQSLSYVFSTVVVLAAVGLLVVSARWLLREQLQDGGRAQRFLGRAILNPVINMGLFLAILPIVFGVALAFVAWVIEQPVCSMSNRSVWCALSALVEQADPFVYAALAALGVAIYSFPKSVAAALGVGRDIVTYSTRVSRANPSEPTGYPTRKRIEDRFEVVYERFTRAHPDAAVTVISHSQGTVISARGLDRLDLSARQKPFLVTMGSPLSHIYTHYFSRDFTFGTDLTDKLSGWENIFRTDDFIGMEVTAGADGFVKNREVPINGHSGYWRDTHVWHWLAQVLLRP